MGYCLYIPHTCKEIGLCNFGVSHSSCDWLANILKYKRKFPLSFFNVTNELLDILRLFKVHMYYQFSTKVHVKIEVCVAIFKNDRVTETRMGYKSKLHTHRSSAAGSKMY